MPDYKVTLTAFGDAEVTLNTYDFDDGVLSPGAEIALEAFLAMGHKARIGATRHVFAYARDFGDSVGWEDLGMEQPVDPDQIWSHVHPIAISLVDRGEGGPWYVSLEANCDWEEEHGLQLVWQDGVALVKVGSYTGHVTNEDAYANSALKDVIYKAFDPRWMTHRGA